MGHKREIRPIAPRAARWPPEVTLRPSPSAWRAHLGSPKPSRDPARLLDGAVNGLRRGHPELSAASPTRLWQKMAVATVLGGLAGASLFMPGEIAAAIFIMLTLPFSFVVVLRGAALAGLFPRAASPREKIAEIPDRDLPVYSLLIPLYKEAAVVPDLVNGLSSLHYPRDKLDILLIVESEDAETYQALTARPLEPCFRLIVVPDGRPRTKPRALNYALSLAEGAYVAVYDAEDLPEPDQLRKAVAALRQGGRELGCVQARLDLHNARETWWTRQFTIEYAGLFRGILPMLARFDLPVPLGGTSNHFPRTVLEKVGGWDPFNVTEDADLGMRLARLKWRVGVIPSTTWEEAPNSFSVWLPQRTRWLKGWLQTYLVHMRQPRRLLRELGVKRFVAFQVLFGGIMLSALVHPWFYVMAGIDALDGRIFEGSPASAGHIIQMLAVFNLAAGYLAAMALGAAAVFTRGRRTLALHALLMPAYWLAISYAAYRALFQLATAPFVWEKTAHRARATRPRAARRPTKV